MRVHVHSKRSLQSGVKKNKMYSERNSGIERKLDARGRLLAPLRVLITKIWIRTVHPDEYIRSIHLKSSCLLIQLTDLNNVSKSEPPST